jgi:protoporphyrinogen oxidase
MTTYILGAGPAGMALADGLISRGDNDFLVIEGQETLGGLAKTIEWEGIGYHDLGPHKLFTQDKELFKRVKELLPEDSWLVQEKRSSIFIEGKYLPYPPSPLSLVGIYGFQKFLSMSFGFLEAKIPIPNRRSAKNFEEDLINRVGKPLYSILFEPIASKIWGLPKNLSTKLSLGRIQTPSIPEIIRNILKIRSSSNFEALEFHYPRKGLGQIWDAIYKKCNPSQFILNASVGGLEVSENRVVSLSFTQNEVETKVSITDSDFIVSTLPIMLTYTLMAKNMSPNHLEDVKRTVVLNDLILVFLHIDKKKLFKESWVFVPDPKVIFHRVSEQDSFDPKMTPNGSIVCIEVMITEEKSNLPIDDSLIDMCISGLNSMGKNDFTVYSSKITVLKRSYPVYKVGYEEGLNQVVFQLDNVENYRTIGRQGSFNYIGTLDAMDIGYGAAEWLADSKSNWDEERSRTSNYPVLD